VGVVRAESVEGLRAEGALEKRAEDVRLDLAPVVFARESQGDQLVLLEMQTGRIFEQSAVDVARIRVHASAGSRAGPIEPLEQRAEIIGARSLRAGDEVVDDLREQVLLELSQILGKHAPDRLQEEVAQLVGPGGAAVAQSRV